MYEWNTNMNSAQPINICTADFDGKSTTAGTGTDLKFNINVPKCLFNGRAIAKITSNLQQPPHIKISNMLVGGSTVYSFSNKQTDTLKLFTGDSGDLSGNTYINNNGEIEFCIDVETEQYDIIKNFKWDFSEYPNGVYWYIKDGDIYSGASVTGKWDVEIYFTEQ